MARLDGKVAIITGAARGMGRATAELFVDEGARVVLVDLPASEVAAVAGALGEAASHRRFDVADEGGWQRLVSDLEERFGRIDILVNNAARYLFATIEDTAEDAFRELLDVNLIGPYLGMKAVIPRMKAQRSGSIINVSSTDGLRGSFAMGAYSATKWGLRGLTKCVAMEVGPFGIRVNSLHPGAVDTPMLNPKGAPRSTLDGWFPGVALSRVAEPAEVARATLFLASDDASYVSGAELAVDGGWTCGVYLTAKPEP